MYRIAFIALVILISGTDLPAREKVKTNLLGAGAGISLPYSYFAKNTFVRDAGFASFGGNCTFDLLRYGRLFGYGLDVGYAGIGFDRKHYLTEYSEILTGQEISVSTGGYHLMKASFCLVLKTPQIRGVELMMMPRMGYCVARHPQILVTAGDYGTINSVESSFGRAMYTGISIRAVYDLTGRYGINLSYSRNRTRPNFRDETSPEEDFWLPIQYQNISIGVFIKLAKKEE
jgi:hypothetical protein